MAARGLSGARCLVSANFRKGPKLKGGSQAREKKKKKKPHSCALLPAGGRAPRAARREAQRGAGEPRLLDGMRNHPHLCTPTLNQSSQPPRGQGSAGTPQNFTNCTCLSTLLGEGPWVFRRFSEAPGSGKLRTPSPIIVDIF